MGRYPDDKITIIVLSNLQQLDVFTLVYNLEQIVFEGQRILSKYSDEVVFSGVTSRRTAGVDT